MLGAAGVVVGVVGCIVGVIVGWFVGRLVVWACLVMLDKGERFWANFFKFSTYPLSLNGLWSVLEDKRCWVGEEYMR